MKWGKLIKCLLFLLSSQVEVNMNKLLVVTVLAALLVFNVEGFRLTRQADEEKGTFTRFTDGIKSYYNTVVNTASDYVESIRGMKLEEKFTNLYVDTKEAAITYGSIFQDQLYHIVYPHSHV
uniref:Apolipoprotein C-II n=1 Tax=Salarias fasciatus TaxID=181472 RepID=A0A672FCP8_SALFA